MKISESKHYQASIDSLVSELSVKRGKILVTGATGLIGSCMIDVLIEANRVGSNFEIYAMGRNFEKLQKRFPCKEVNIICQDVANTIHVRNLDYIIHAASNADPHTYALYPAETIITNVLGAKNVLDCCRDGKTRALLMSTFEVYGKCEKDIYSEDDFGLIDQNKIRSCYPESKRIAELLFKTYYAEYEVNCVIARLASIYGPTMALDDSKAHAQFIRYALKKENIVLKSKGDQKRTYCYLMDAVSGLFKVLFEGKAAEAYNVANKDSVVTIAEVANTLAQIADTKVVFELPNEVEKKGYSKHQNCILNTEKLEALGWHGKYSLESGMRETMKILSEIGWDALY